MNARYTRTAIGLHWLMALLLVGIFGVGLYMHELPLSPGSCRSTPGTSGPGHGVPARPRPPRLAPHAPTAASSRHDVAGVAARGARRPRSALSADDRDSIDGWLMSSAKGSRPVLRRAADSGSARKDKELGDLLRDVHATLNFLLAAVVAGHVAAALKHHLIDRDDVLRRMLPPPRADSPARLKGPVMKRAICSLLLLAGAR